MTKMKFLGSFLLVLTVLFAQVGGAAAAPQAQEGTITVTGEITKIGTPQTDAEGVTTVPVTVTATDGTETVVLVKEADAADLHIGDKVDWKVNPNDVVPPDETEEEDVHPIAALLGTFFDVDDGEVNDFHQDGFGFGVIAQALWMSKDLNDGTADATLAGEILQAKKDKTFEQFYEDHKDLFNEDSTAPKNWGQLKKALKEHNSVGQAKPGHGNNEDSLNVQENNKKNNGNKDNGNKDKGNQGKNDSNPGKGKGNGKP